MRAPCIALWPFLPALLAAQPLIEAGDRHEMRSIGHLVEILEDPKGLLTLENAIATDGYERSQQDVPNFHVSRSTFWVRFGLRNTGTQEGLFLHIPQPDIGSMDIHAIARDGTSILEQRMGQSIPLTQWGNKDIDMWTRIPVPAGGEATIYLRVSSDKLLRLPIHVGTGVALAEVRSWRDGFGGAYVGVILVMLLYNLFIFLSTRDRSYLHYVLYISLVGVTQADFLGINKHYLWPESPWLGHGAAFVLTIVTAVAANRFMHRFLNTEVHAPGTRRFAWFFYALFIVGLSMKAMGLDIVSYNLLQGATGGIALYQLIVGIIALRNGSRSARFFLIAWTIFLLGVMLFVLKDLDVLPYTSLTKSTMVVGSAVEVVLLSFGLADRINELRREKERSQAAALEASRENERIIREQNVILESKVLERTRALRESNEHLKRTQAQLVNAEKMASIGQLTAGIAHEINNPINFITSNIGPLRRNIQEILEVMKGYRSLEEGDAADRLRELKELEHRMDIATSIEELDDIIGSIAEGSSRTAEIVRGLRNFSRLDEDDLKESDLNEGIRSTLSVLAPQYRDRVTFRLELGDIPKVECFPGKVNQVFMNILTNAAQATIAKPGDHERLVTARTTCDGDTVTISISDNGTGMDEAVKARVFEPFFTTKPVGEGTGLGMAIVYSIVEEHHGAMEIDSTPELGSEFKVTLPLRHSSLKEKRA